ncbi:DUF3667 domain-containing protein [Ekhidna sp.]|uniref:DUF3667 domain-containing protein n=1 Tax=Ekhidna sp. TaxID=2608089 RepID=UPI00329868AE
MKETVDMNRGSKKFCLNCESEVHATYCSICGQRFFLYKPNLGLLITEFFQTFFLLDLRVYRTIREILKKQGRFVKSYIDGRQVDFVGPVHFFILILGVYLLVFVSVGNLIYDSINDSFVQEDETKQKIEQLGTFLKINLNYLYFLLPLVFAMVMGLFIQKGRYNFAEKLIVSFYLIGIAILMNSGILLLALLNVKLFALRILIIIIPLPIALMQLKDEYGISDYFKSLAVVLLSYFIYAILVAGITILMMK